MQEKNYYSHKFVAVSSIVTLVCIAFLAIPPQTNAQFIFATWDYPDNFGQGIDVFTVWENSTGSWVQVGGNRDYDQPDEHLIDWNATIFMKVRVWTWFNSTLTGAGDWQEGRWYQRHIMNVTSAGQYVYNKANFTFLSVIQDAHPMWYYHYEQILVFEPQWSNIYTVTITYEVFY